MTTRTGRRAMLAAATAGAFLISALAVVPQASASTLYACVKKNGSAHIYAKKPKCKKGESKLSWNTAGPAGSPGSPGSAGKDGAGGKDGAAGKNGLDGTAVAYAEVSSTGKLEGNSKGIAKMTPGKSPGEGVYCLELSNPSAVHVGIAGLNPLGGGSQPGFASVDMGPFIEVIFEECATGTTVAIHTYNKEGKAAPEGVFAIFD